MMPLSSFFSSFSDNEGLKVPLCCKRVGEFSFSLAAIASAAALLAVDVPQRTSVGVGDGAGRRIILGNGAVDAIVLTDNSRVSHGH